MLYKFSAGIIIIIIAFGGYYGYTKYFSSAEEIKYVLAPVKKGTLIISVSGSGQILASNQADIKPKVSGEIMSVYVTSGQEAAEGALLAAIDARDAERAVRDAETGLETARLELDRLLEPLDELTLLQAENSLIQARESKQKAEDDLKKAYEDGFNDIANAFLELPDIMVGLQDVLYGTNLSAGVQSNISYYADTIKSYDEKILKYKDDAAVAYQKARAAYDKNFIDYKSASRFSDRQTIEMLLAETYNTSKDTAEAVKNSSNLIQFHKDKLIERGLRPAAFADTHLAALSTYTGKTNSHLSVLLSIQRTIQNSKEAIVSSERSIEEKNLSLEKIKSGPDNLDIRAKKITIQQREDALVTAKQTLADHYVRAPFAGVIAKVNAKKGDSASAGAAVATLVTKQKIAEVSLNEVDVAKVKAGQKTTLTIDAIPGLTLTGQAAEVDAIGTISQGVVSYAVKIAFDTQDERVKPAMSVSANIITEAKPDILMIPNSAVKLQDGVSFAEIPQENIALPETGQGGIALTQTPLRRQVEVGLYNDEFTEIISGLKEGDTVVTNTISSQTTSTSQQQGGGFRIPGLPGGGGGGGRQSVPH